MKKSIFTIGCILATSLLSAQTTATDFTANDCSGTSHHLFAEMDAGKIIVAAFVMPCGSCAPNSIAAYNAVQSYASSNPNTVYFYLVDDNANTSCNTLTSWGNSNSMSNAIKFSNSAFTMSDYGTPGMPKIVVMGGSNHSIVYNKNSGVSTSGVQAAINSLLSASVNEIKENTPFSLKAIPNPGNGVFNLEYSVQNNSDVVIELFTVSGKLIKMIEEKNVQSGSHSVLFDSSNNLETGSYFVKVTSNNETQTINVIVE